MMAKTLLTLLLRFSAAVKLKTMRLGVEGLEPSRPMKSTDFKSVVSTIPPYPL